MQIIKYYVYFFILFEISDTKSFSLNRAVNRQTAKQNKKNEIQSNLLLQAL